LCTDLFRAQASPFFSIRGVGRNLDPNLRSCFARDEAWLPPGFFDDAEFARPFFVFLRQEFAFLSALFEFSVSCVIVTACLTPEELAEYFPGFLPFDRWKIGKMFLLGIASYFSFSAALREKDRLTLTVYLSLSLRRVPFTKPPLPPIGKRSPPSIRCLRSASTKLLSSELLLSPPPPAASIDPRTFTPLFFSFRVIDSHTHAFFCSNFFSTRGTFRHAGLA